MQIIIKKKINTHECNLQNLWDLLKRPNLRNHGKKEGGEIQTKGIGKLFNEIIAEIFQIYVMIQAPL
jgi:hypothetical protein